MSDTPNLGLPLLAEGQAQKHITVNEALVILDLLAQLSVLRSDLTTPPGTPAEGDRYVVAASATGAWAGKDGNIAAFSGGAWAFYAPEPGWVVYDLNAAGLYVYSGGAWVGVSPSVISIKDINFTLLDDGDTTKKAQFDVSGVSTGTTRIYTFPNASVTLAGLSNTQTFSGTNTFSGTLTHSGATGSYGTSTGNATYGLGSGATTGTSTKAVNIGTGGVSGSTTNVTIGSATSGALGSLTINSPTTTAVYLGLGGATPDATNRFSINTPAILLNHAGAGMQAKMNKNAAGDTVSLLFQTGFSGRAEFGLAGSDDYSVKVSPDGSAWTTVYTADKTTGRLTITKTPTVTDQAPATITYGASLTPDLSTGRAFKVTLTGNMTLNAPTNLVAGAGFWIRLTQDGTGSRTITFNSAFKFAGGTAPTLTTTAGASDMLYCVVVDASTPVIDAALRKGV